MRGAGPGVSAGPNAVRIGATRLPGTSSGGDAVATSVPRHPSRGRRSAALVAVALLAVIVPVTATAAEPSTASAAPPIGAIETFGSSLQYPTDITAGPDGNLWIAAGHGIGRMSTDGVLRVFPLPESKAADDITGGPDGNVWFTAGQAIGRMTPTGEVAMFETTLGWNGDIAAGPDGMVWFTSSPAGSAGPPGSISRITPSGAVTTFAGAGIDHPYSIVAGADGNLWFTDFATDAIGRITPTGVVTTFTDPGLDGPWSITLGPDGNVWFGASASVGRITPAGAITLFPATPGYVRDLAPGSDGNVWFTAGGDAVHSITPMGVVTTIPLDGSPGELALGADGDIWALRGSFTPGLATISPLGVVTDVSIPVAWAPWAIAAGSDGNMWFTAMGSNTIGRTDRSGVVTSFEGDGIDSPSAIVEGPDQNLWFTNWGSDSIGRITHAGSVSNFTAPGLDAPTNIVVGPDGNLWFTMDYAHSLGQITPAGAVSFIPLSFNPSDLVSGPDGNLWLTDHAGDAVWRVAPTGAASTFTGPGIDGPGDITVGPDGNLWFTNWPDESIGRVTPAGTITAFATPGLSPTILTSGPDGHLWFTSRDERQIGRLSPSGELATVAEPNGNTPLGISAGSDGAVWYADPGGDSLGRISATEPGAPVFVAAIAGKQSATVSWRAPPEPVGSPISGYSVVASPGGASCSTTVATSCSVSGLTAGTAYTFSVRAIGAGGPGPAATTTVPVVPWSGSRFHPLVPSRILDSRRNDSGFSGRVTSTTARDLQVTGRGGASNVPASASAVVLNVTATDSSEASFLTVFAWGTTKPNASNLNVGPGQVRANLVTVKVGAGGKVAIATSNGSTNVVADVVGYYDDGVGTSGDLFNPMTPRRFLDTRTLGGPIKAAAPVDLPVRADISHPLGVPVSATAVVANVTVTNASDQTFVSLYPTGQPQPNVSNLNALPGQTLANLATVKIGEGGAIRIANAVGSVNVIVDVVGWFEPGTGSRFHAMAPNRVLDTRLDKGLVGAFGPGQTRALPVAGATGTEVPAGATGLVANVTGADASAETFVAVFPGAVARPNPYSTLNLPRGGIVANLVAVGIAPNGTINLYNHLGRPELVADVVGWYASS